MGFNKPNMYFSKAGWFNSFKKLVLILWIVHGTSGHNKLNVEMFGVFFFSLISLWTLSIYIYIFFLKLPPFKRERRSKTKIDFDIPRFAEISTKRRVHEGTSKWTSTIKSRLSNSSWEEN